MATIKEQLKEKLKAVTAALTAIEKQFGKGAIMSLGGTDTSDIPVIPTGSVGLDLALGVGGLPRGRVVEIFGPESSGKTTLTLHAIAQAQKAGGICAFIDAEHALDVTYARKLGVRIEDLLVSQPDNGEQALEIADKLVGTGAIDMIVVDSVAALVPKAEIEGEMGDAHMGLQARLMSQALRKLTAATSRNATCVVFINQMPTWASGQDRGIRPRARHVTRSPSARLAQHARHAPERGSARSPPASPSRLLPGAAAARRHWRKASPSRSCG
ncbi:MAG: recombinase RecA [Polyangia bacterium]|jgi:recombination protein RecA